MKGWSYFVRVLARVMSSTGTCHWSRSTEVFSKYGNSREVFATNLLRARRYCVLCPGQRFPFFRLRTTTRRLDLHHSKSANVREAGDQPVRGLSVDARPKTPVRQSWSFDRRRREFADRVPNTKPWQRRSSAACFCDWNSIDNISPASGHSNVHCEISE